MKETLIIFLILLVLLIIISTMGGSIRYLAPQTSVYPADEVNRHHSSSPRAAAGHPSTTYSTKRPVLPPRESDPTYPTHELNEQDGMKDSVPEDFYQPSHDDEEALDDDGVVDNHSSSEPEGYFANSRRGSDDNEDEDEGSARIVMPKAPASMEYTPTIPEAGVEGFAAGDFATW
jgi:hypothetical protein